MKTRTEISDLQRIAGKIRATCIQMAFDAGHGHLKSTLSCADILVALYWDWLNVSPSNPTDSHRDRFYMSKGHGVTSLYAVLAEKGFIAPNINFENPDEDTASLKIVTETIEEAPKNVICIVNYPMYCSENDIPFEIIKLKFRLCFF